MHLAPSAHSAAEATYFLQPAVRYIQWVQIDSFDPLTLEPQASTTLSTRNGKQMSGTSCKLYYTAFAKNRWDMYKTKQNQQLCGRASIMHDPLDGAEQTPIKQKKRTDSTYLPSPDSVICNCCNFERNSKQECTKFRCSNYRCCVFS